MQKILFKLADAKMYHTKYLVYVLLQSVPQY